MHKLALFFVSFFWGVSFIFTKQYLEVIHPLLFTAWTFLLAGGIFFILAKGRSKQPLTFRLREGMILGVFLFFLEAPQMIGLSETSAANTAFITSLGILLIPLAEWVIYRRAVTLYTWLALLVAGFGLYYLTGGIGVMNRGDAWVILAALGCMLYMVYSDHYEKEERSDLFVLCTQQFLTVGLLALGMAFLTQVSIVVIPSHLYMPLVYLTLFFTFVPYLLIQWAERYASEVEVTFYGILEPVIGGIAAWTIGRESPTLMMVIGGILVIGALIVSETRKVVLTPVRTDGR